MSQTLNEKEPEAAGVHGPEPRPEAQRVSIFPKFVAQSEYSSVRPTRCKGLNQPAWDVRIVTVRAVNSARDSGPWSETRLPMANFARKYCQIHESRRYSPPLKVLIIEGSLGCLSRLSLLVRKTSSPDTPSPDMWHIPTTEYSAKFENSRWTHHQAFSARIFSSPAVDGT